MEHNHANVTIYNQFNGLWVWSVLSYLHSELFFKIPVIYSHYSLKQKNL